MLSMRMACFKGMELVAQPLLLFADEPTSGLDSTTSHEALQFAAFPLKDVMKQVVRCLNGAAAGGLSFVFE